LKSTKVKIAKSSFEKSEKRQKSGKYVQIQQIDFFSNYIGDCLTSFPPVVENLLKSLILGGFLA